MSDLVLIYCEPGYRLATVLCPECGRISQQSLLTAFFSNRVTELIKPHTCPTCKVVYKKCDPSQSDYWSYLAARYYSDPEAYNQTVKESYPNKKSTQVSLLSYLTDRLNRLKKEAQVQSERYWICTVSFQGISAWDSYISDSGELKPGTEVVVTDNRHKVGIVRECQSYTAKEAPLPLDEMKHIISVQMDEKPIYDLVPSFAKDIETTSLVEKNETISLTGNIEAAPLVINEQDFQIAINSLKKFVNNSKDLSIPSVPASGGLFGLGDHKVTGSELNIVTSQISNSLFYLRNQTLGLVSVIGSVYKAFFALKSDYISGIVSSLVAIKKVHEDERQQKKRIDENVKVLNKHTEQIKKSIQVLEKFKYDIDKLKHIYDVDKVWDLIKEQQKICDSLVAYNEQLSGIVHLLDVDDIWYDASLLKEDVSELRDSIEEAKAGLSELQNVQEDYESRVSDTMSNYSISFDQKIQAQSDAIKKHKDDFNSALNNTYTELERRFKTLSEENLRQIAEAKTEQAETLAAFSEEQASTVGKMQKMQDDITAQKQLQQESEESMRKELSDFRSLADQKLRAQADALKKQMDDIDSALGKTSSELDHQIQMLSEQSQQQIADAQKEYAQKLAALSGEQTSTVDKMQKLQDDVTAQKQTQQESEESIRKEFSDFRSWADQTLRAQADALKKHKDDIDSALGKTSSELDHQIQIFSEQSQQQIADAQKTHAEALAQFAEEQALKVDSIQKAQEERFGTFTASQEKQIEVIANTLETEKASLQETVSHLKQKLKTAYILAGSAAALALTGFMLNLLGVL